MPGTEFLTAASITVIPGSASTTRSVPSCTIYVIFAMALARLASLQSWETSGGRQSPAPVAAGADGTRPRTWRVSYRAIETETPAPSGRRDLGIAGLPRAHRQRARGGLLMRRGSLAQFRSLFSDRLPPILGSNVFGHFGSRVTVAFLQPMAGKVPCKRAKIGRIRQ